jgi:hypothetical protein
MTGTSVLAAFIILALVTTWVTEVSATLFWSPRLFKWTPRLWTAVVDHPPGRTPVEFEIENTVNDSALRPLVFRRLSNQEVAFRESFLSWRPGVGIYGLISEDLVTGRLTISSRTSWLLCIALGSMGLTAVIQRTAAAAILVALVLAGLVAGQRFRLNTIVKAISGSQ